MSVTARCMECGAEWATKGGMVTDPPDCYGLPGHEHRMFTEANEQGVPVVPFAGDFLP